MNVRHTTPEDLATVNGWLGARGLKPHPPGLAAARGFILEGRAACWLLVLENASGALLEFLVAAPGQTDEDRSDAVDAVVEAAMTEARSLGLRFVFSTTELPAVAERSKKHGFSVLREGLIAICADLGG
jgi:hypothetical protein